MKSFKLIIKGVLLWLTAFVVLISICDIDNIINTSFTRFLGIIILDIVLILSCIKLITKQEFIIISGYNYFRKAFNLDVFED